MKRKALNLVSLACIQVSSAVLPLFIFPFTLGVVGADLYSQIVLAEALAMVLLAVVLYSFEVDGVAQVVGLAPGKDTQRLSHIFSAIFYSRMMLFIVAAPLVVVAALCIDEKLLLPTLCWLMVPLSYAVQPGWLFQGLERNAPMAVCAVLSRGLAVSLVLMLVHGQSDYLFVPLIIGCLYLVGAIGALLYAIYHFGIRLVVVPFADLRQMFWSGKEIFLGNLSVILYRDVNVIVLSALGVGGSGVAAYSMAEKIVKSIQASIRPLNQLFFPQALRLAQLASKPGRQTFLQLLKITLPQLVVLALLLLVLVTGYLSLGEHIAWLRQIENLDHVAALVGLMSLATFFGVSNFMFGIAGLNVLGERQYLFKAILFTGVLSLAACLALVLQVAETGAALSFVIAEALLLFFILLRYFR